MNTLQEIIGPWLRSEGSEELQELAARVDWLRRHLFDDYEPEEFRRFDERLADWLLNVDDDEDRKTLFRLVGQLFFLGKPQFKALCRSTFSDTVTRWLLDLFGIGIDDEDVAARLDAALKQTWFGSITDSMNLNTFLKTNHLGGHELRPDWRTLSRLGSGEGIRGHVKEGGIKAMVLLEDFVGSGEQMRTAVTGVRAVLPDIPLLVAPLICCPGGVEEGRHLAALHRITFQPTIQLGEDTFLLPEAHPEEPPAFDRARDLIGRVRDRLGPWRDEEFGHHQTGALVAMYTNCPDNTLPIIHEQSDSWSALFRRIRRE